MGDETNCDKTSFVQDLAEEYRRDTLVRLTKVAVAIRELSDGAANKDDLVGEIMSHSHSIKGTSNTFGFSGLSVISHAMDDFLCTTKLPAGDPVFQRDLEHLNDLMIAVAGSSPVVSAEEGAERLALLELKSDGGGTDAATSETADTPLTALLVMEHSDGRDTISRTLGVLGFSTITTQDGVQSIDLATARQPNVIVLALHGTRFSAPDLIQVFSEINATAVIPLIVVLPDPADTTGGINDDAIELLVSGLTAGVRKVTQGAGMNRALSAVLIEQGIISG